MNLFLLAAVSQFSNTVRCLLGVYRATEATPRTTLVDESNNNKNNKLMMFFCSGLMLVSTLLLAAPSLHAQHGGHGEHGDHNPHHGGVVLMFGADLHYEVVMKPTGDIELWLSNAARADLPATVVMDVAAEVETPKSRHPVDMTINDSGDAWIGKAAAVQAEGTTLHLGFVYQGEAASLSFPATSLMGEGREQLIKDTAHETPLQTQPSHDHSGHAAPKDHSSHSMTTPGNNVP